MQIVTCTATMANKEILIFAQLFFVAAVGGALIQRPLNEATSVGGQTVFNCSSDTGAITWLYTTNCNTAGGDELTDSNCNIKISYASHYKTEKSGEFVCNLIVFDALLSLGGCYACADGFGAGRLFQAMLIIVDSNANITTNSTDIIPGEDIVISTSVSYRGPSIPLQPPPLPPSFYWTLQSDPSHNITSYPGSTTTNTSASSYIVVTAQPPNVPPYLCNLFFNAPVVVPASCADNAPTYSRSWTTPTYSVSYPPQNLIISGTPNPCLHEPVQLTCSASGYPTPTYKWFDLTSGAVLSESNTVTIDRDGSYQCVASNQIKNVPYNASKTVNISDCEPAQNVSITASTGPCADSCGNLSSDTLTCKASGFPEIEYEWSFSGEEVAGSIVIATKNIGYQCTATNYYADQPHSASTTLQVYWLTVYTSVNLGMSDPACISLLVIVIYLGLNLLFFTIFILCYGCSENGRNTLNDRFPLLKKMLPCMNDEVDTGCKCSVWIFYFVILSIFAAFVFFPMKLIIASCCCNKKRRTYQGYGQLNEKYRNERGGRGTKVKTLGTAPYQYPSRMSVTSLDTSAHFQPDPTDRIYPQSSTQQHQPTYWGSYDLYPQLPMPLPRKSPSPALSTGGVVYAQLGVDNQPKSRHPIQPIQNDANTYADIAIA